jgi:predicted permease
VSTQPRPPRLAVALLERILPPTESAAAMIGDLHEEFLGRARTDARAARMWYVREAVGIALRYWRRGRRYRPGSERLGTSTTGTGGWEGTMDTLLMNVRYSVRRLLKSPMFTLVAVSSLALGIGANTAMFSLVNAAIIRDVPFSDPESLVDVYEEGDGFSHATLSYPDYLDFTEGTADVFESVGGMQLAMTQLDTDDGVETLYAEAVTGNYFSLLGIEAEMGRLFSEQDHVALGAHPVVVLSHDQWVGRFGSDPSVLGREVRMGGRPYTVIGVAPEAFAGTVRGLEPDVYVPIMMVNALQGTATDVLEARGNQSFFAKARLRPGSTMAQAESVAERVGNRIREENPTQWGSDKAFVLEPTADVIMNPMIDRFLVPAAGMIMTVVGLVLLIACANLASFLLARAADRRKEIAVRLAMGARRRSLIGQLLTETVILSGAGGLAGVFLAARALDALVAADLPLPLPITLDLSLDTTVLTFSLVVSLVAGVLFGLAPALQSTRPDVASTLRDETAGGGRARGALLRNALVVGQVAVSVVLLVSAGLFLRSLDASRRIDPGFGDAPTGLVQLVIPADRYGTESGMVLVETLRDRIAAKPGVRSVGLVDNLPLEQLNTQYTRVRVEGVEPPAGRDFHSVDYARADETFLEAAGIPIVEGRGFQVADQAGGEPVVLVNEEFARLFFPEGGAVDRTILVNDEPVRVVGVTADHKVRQLGEAPRPFIYHSYRQNWSNFVWLVASTDGDAERLSLDMLAEARALDPEIMVASVRTMRTHLAILLLGRELGAMVVGGFAVLALLLAVIGLYGVVSYAVSRRAKEVGIRLSLGADAGSVIRLLTGSGMKLVAIGALIGLAVAASASQLLSRLLYGIPPLDVATFVSVPVVLGVVAFLASWIPARRVTRIDPVGALRSE